MGDLGLRSRHLRPLVEDLLQEHFYSRVLYNLKQRKLNGYLHQVTLRCTVDLVWKYEIVIPFHIVCLFVCWSRIFHSYRHAAIADEYQL